MSGRALWKGTVSFGLVNIPISLHTAVREADDKISFRMIHKGCGSTIKYERVCEKHKKVVPWEEIGKGYEYEKGKLLPMDDEDFRAAAIESTKALDIAEFVQQSEIDPRYFEVPYYVLPQKGAERGYALIREAMKATGTVGLGLVTLRGNAQHLVGLRAVDDALVMEVMRYSACLVDTSEFSFPANDGLRPQELQMAQQLISNMIDKFDPDKYANEYRTNLMTIIKDKLAGKGVSVKEPEAQPATNVVDLMDKLTASLQVPKKTRKQRTA